MYSARRILITGLALCLGFPPAADARTKRRAARPKAAIAVINAKQTPVLREPIAGAQVIDIAAKGKKVRVLDETDDGYTQILFKDSFGIALRGWVESHRLARPRKAPPKADEVEPLDGEIEGFEAETPRAASRADEWALAAPSLFFWNEWAIGYQPRRWRPMLAIASRYIGTSYQVKFGTTNLGALSLRTVQTHAHLGFGIWRRFAAYVTQPHNSVASIAEFTGAAKATRKQAGLQEPELRLTGLLIDRTSRTNLLFGVLHSPGEIVRYDSAGQVSNSVRGRAMNGFLVSYWDINSAFPWFAFFDLRRYGEAMGRPGRGGSEEGFTDVSAGGAFRLNEKEFITDFAYTIFLHGARAARDADGSASDIRTSPSHRLSADARYLISGASALVVSAAATAGGIMKNSDGLEQNPNVGLQGGIGFHHSF